MFGFQHEVAVEVPAQDHGQREVVLDCDEVQTLVLDGRFADGAPVLGRRVHPAPDERPWQGQAQIIVGLFQAFFVRQVNKLALRVFVCEPAQLHVLGRRSPSVTRDKKNCTLSSAPPESISNRWLVKAGLYPVSLMIAAAAES